jgi:hypothetical protein
MRYHAHIDGEDEWVRIKSLRGFRIRCCDCGKVDVLDFRIRKVGGKNHIEFRERRDNRATAWARKTRKYSATVKG